MRKATCRQQFGLARLRAGNQGRAHGLLADCVGWVERRKLLILLTGTAPNGRPLSCSHLLLRFANAAMNELTVVPCMVDSRGDIPPFM